MRFLLLGLFFTLPAFAISSALTPKNHPSPKSSIAPSPHPSSEPSPLPPAISTLLKPSEYKSLGNQEIISRARLTDQPDGLKKYSYFASMALRSDLKKTRGILTDYKVYSKLIPYISKTDFDPKTKVLEVEGGIWRYRLHSWIQFDDENERWIHYRIIAGHFQGLEGNMYFEAQGSHGEKGTAVYFDGNLEGSHWPPKWVIERGAEIVFGYTARRMRSYISTQESSSTQTTEGASHEQGLPQPRSHFTTGQ